MFDVGPFYMYREYCFIMVRKSLRRRNATDRFSGPGCLIKTKELFFVANNACVLMPFVLFGRFLRAIV
jgi:hypothetical protein